MPVEYGGGEDLFFKLCKAPPLYVCVKMFIFKILLDMLKLTAIILSTVFMSLTKKSENSIACRTSEHLPFQVKTAHVALQIHISDDPAVKSAFTH